jgi:hypothetical protein
VLTAFMRGDRFDTESMFYATRRPLYTLLVAAVFRFFAGSGSLALGVPPVHLNRHAAAHIHRTSSVRASSGNVTFAAAL